MRWRALLFGSASGFWFAATVPALVLAATRPSLATFTLPMVTMLSPMAGLIARRKGRGRLGWLLLAVPLAWIVLAASVSRLAQAL